MTTRNFAMALGVIYIVVGVLGFVPRLLTSPAEAPPLTVNQSYGYLFGLFPVNILHSLVHLAIGVWGVLAARSALGGARTYAASVAVIFGVLTVMGFIPRLNTVFGLIPLFGHDVWLHALTAIVAAYFGFGESRMAEELRDRTRRAA
jgi:uncharacterized protein DUF4383